MRELNKRVSPTAPMQAAPATPTNGNLVDTVYDISRQLNSIMNEIEGLASKMCGPYPIPSLGDDGPPEGIIAQVIWATNIQRMMIDRITTAVTKINQDL